MFKEGDRVDIVLEYELPPSYDRLTDLKVLDINEWNDVRVFIPGWGAWWQEPSWLEHSNKNYQKIKMNYEWNED